MSSVMSEGLNFPQTHSHLNNDGQKATGRYEEKLVQPLQTVTCVYSRVNLRD